MSGKAMDYGFKGLDRTMLYVEVMSHHGCLQRVRESLAMTVRWHVIATQVTRAWSRISQTATGIRRESR